MPTRRSIGELPAIWLLWGASVLGLVGCGNGGEAGMPVEQPVQQQSAVSSVTVTPNTASIVTGQSVPLTATTKDAAGTVLTGRVVAWSSSNIGVAAVDSSGLVTGVAMGQATITATSEGRIGSAMITVISTAPLYISVSAGGLHSCGVDTDGDAFCWGDNSFGQLGNGTTTNSTTPVLIPLGLIEFIDGGVSAGTRHTCGAVNELANGLCWGNDSSGQLGDGGTTNRPTPTVVAGGLEFSTVKSGGSHSCGVITTGHAFCWGDNSSGQLGNGTLNNNALPVAVLGGLSLAEVCAGGLHTCGLTISGAAFCWGDNSFGQLGNGTTTNSSTPVAVLGGHTFKKLSAGINHSCGVTSDGAVLCWGSNSSGQLGSGTTLDSRVPVTALGGLTFAAVSAGNSHSCGVTTGGAGFCWGNNSSGQLGNGTSANSATPVAVSGGLSLADVSAGGLHTCARTTGGAAYCWGSNSSGQLGNGTNTDSALPVKVAGQP